MNWKTLILDLLQAGLSQAEIGAELGKSQAWVCALSVGKYKDVKWGDGEALRRLHSAKVSHGETPDEQQRGAA